MACLICGAAAETVQPIDDYHERDCGDGCGRYRVSGTLFATRRNKGQSFDVQLTRQWLAINRVANPAPLITSSIAIYA